VLDSALVDRVIEYAVSPLPLACTPIAGLATVGPTVALSLRFSRTVAGVRLVEGRRARVKGVLLVPRTRGGKGTSHARWVVEVDEVRSFVRVRVGVGGEQGSDPDRSPWIVPATALASGGGGDVRSLAWLDADRMMRELGDGELA
jgi:hypothetical protein